MANNVDTTTVAPAAYPNATKIATQQLADTSHASVAVITNPATRAQQLLINAAGEAPVAVADGASVTQGAKADAAWDGAAAGPTIMAVKKYEALKVEAVRAALVTDGANVTIGAKADTVWDGAAASISAMGIFKYLGAKLEAIRAALVDAAAVSLVKQVKDNGRVSVVVKANNVRNTSTGETVLTLSISRDGAAFVGGSPTSYSPTAGKRFRLESILAFLQNPSTNTTAAGAIVRIRQNPSGAAIISSVEHEVFGLAGVSAASSPGTTVNIPISEGREIPDGAGICITGIVPTWVTNTADPGFQVTLIGYEYTP